MTCPKCFKESFFTISSYAFKKYIKMGNLIEQMFKKSFAKKTEHCCNRHAVTNFLQISRKLPWKISREVLSAIQVEISATVIITVALTLPF